jgi:hypothetical protein
MRYAYCIIKAKNTATQGLMLADDVAADYLAVWEQNCDYLPAILTNCGSSQVDVFMAAQTIVEKAPVLR